MDRSNPELLLTHGWFLHDDPKEAVVMKPYAPLGILYLSAWLKRAGRSVEIFDATFSNLDELRRRLESGSPTILGVYATFMTRVAVVRILAIARELRWTVVVGGPDPANWPAEYLGAGADVVVFGEGERTIEELVPVLSARGADPEALAAVPGIAFLRPDGGLERTAERELISDLDSIPFPDRDAVDIPAYLRCWREVHGEASLTFLTARGCPYRCRWCSRAVFGSSSRHRSAANVVDEVEGMLERWNPESFWIADDVLTINRKRFLELDAEMKRRGVRIRFECTTRADRIDPEVADALARLGCFRVWIGGESGSPRILESMNRGVTVEQIERSIAEVKKVGIEAGLFLIWGYEGEEMEDIVSTVGLVRRSDPGTVLTTVAYPIKGTEYHARVADRIVDGRPWGESSDREVAIRGRHSRRFYSLASAWLRHEHRLARLEKEPPGLARSAALAGGWIRSRAARFRLERAGGEREA